MDRYNSRGGDTRLLAMKIQIEATTLRKLIYNAHMAGQGVEEGVAWEVAERYANSQLKQLLCRSRHVNQFRRPDGRVECPDCGAVW